MTEDGPRRLEADLTSVPYEKQLPPIGDAAPASPVASTQSPSAAPAAPAGPGLPGPAATVRPRPQDRPNSVKKQLEHIKPIEASTATPVSTTAPTTARLPGTACYGGSVARSRPSPTDASDSFCLTRRVAEQDG